MARDITFVSWLWKDVHARHQFKSQHVNTWARMLKENCTVANRVVCITDQPEGITECETAPIWECPPVAAKNWQAGRPQCYRRMRIFDPEVSSRFGDYIVSMDLDVVILHNIDPLFLDYPDFRILQGGGRRNCYNGSMWMFRADARPQLWSQFTPERAAAASQEFMGSDQAWMRFTLGPNEQVWNSSHGVHQYLMMNAHIPPPKTKIVFFAGAHKPWHFMVQARHKWIVTHWGKSDDPPPRPRRGYIKGRRRFA